MMDSALPRELLVQELQKPDAQVNLAKAALYLAQDEYPHLEVATHLAILDDMAEQLRTQLPAAPYPLKIIQTLNRVMFDELGFQGNVKDYYDPRNSFLNEVLTRRKGIPITLSLVYLELAKRINFPMVGIGMPGHFLIRPTVDEMDIFIDVFHGGEVLFTQDCNDRFKQMFGDGAALNMRHLEPVTARAFLVRMLTNLKMIYLQQRDVTKALDAIEKILLIQPEAVTERRDRGLIYYQQGKISKAYLDLEYYLYEKPDAVDAYEIRQVMHQIERVQEEGGSQ
jgi:regulator of sirC expression with transglutaminase-like and TPR domain